jgi:cytochrome bd-type quinol oxidase subunit 2
VGDPACEVPDRLELLRLPKLILQPNVLGHVTDHDRDLRDLACVAGDWRYGRGDNDIGSVLVPHPRFGRDPTLTGVHAFMGTVVGAVASGRVPANGSGDRLTSWCNGTSLLVGVQFVATCAYVSATFLIADARRAGDFGLERYFRRRAIAAAVVTGGLAAAGLVVLHEDARYIYDGLTSDALGLVIVSAVCGAGALALLVRGNAVWARPFAVGAVIAVVWGWGVAQHPYLLPTTLKIDAGAAPYATLVALVVVLGVAVLVIGPALALLFTLHQRSLLDEQAPAGGERGRSGRS